MKKELKEVKESLRQYALKRDSKSFEELKESILEIDDLKERFETLQKIPRRKFLKCILGGAAASFMSLYLGDFFRRHVVNREPLLGAHYYNFYEANPYDQKYTRFTPILGWYDSKDENIIKEHMRLAKMASIDFFIISLWSFKDRTFPGIEKMFKLSETVPEPPKICMMIEVYDKDRSEIQELIDYTWENWVDKNYQKLYDKPLLLLLTAETYEKRNEALKISNPGFTLRYMDKFPVMVRDDGTFMNNIWNYWTILEIFFVPWGNFPFAEQFAVMPGYDDSLFRGEHPHPHRESYYYHGYPRRKEVYELYWMAAHLMKTPIVTLSSFNEFYEHTAIEPCWNFGNGIKPYHYIETTPMYKKGNFLSTE